MSGDTEPARWRRPLAVGLGIGLLLGVGLLAPTVWTRVVAHDRVLTEAQAPAREVAIIFGAEMYASGEPSPYLRARLDLGVELYRDGKARVLVVSGENSEPRHFETTNMRRYLERHGIPAAAIVEDEFGLDTYDTCVRAREVFGVTSALLVSQRYHLSRAVATCEAVGVQAVGVGDVSVKQTSRRWNEFSRREVGANLKLMVDLATHRQPSLEGPADAVTRALNA